MSTSKGAKMVREPVQVYLDPPDLSVLSELVEATGLSKAELLRRGLRRLSAETLGERAPGASLETLIGSLDGGEAGPDLSTRHDEYLYGGRARRGKRGRPGVR
ncbi:MAG: ribbon-helix-helix protein, CopG family [Gemmatimonadales bacterium]